MSENRLTNGNLALDQKKVIVIEATEPTIQQKVRVAAYCRVSSDSTDQLNSFMAQTNYYSAKIASKENWTMVDIYADAGITGTSAEKRPDFQRLLSDCRRGYVDKVLVKSISRFARNAQDCLEIIRELKSIGVSVYFEEQNIDTSKMTGELLTAIFAAIAQKESESISGNMRWSYQQRMSSGSFITNSAPFGYRLNDRGLEICESEAEIVRFIFDQYLIGKSADEIAEQVTSMRIPTRLGNENWNTSSIFYILRNEKYLGNALLQKKYTTETLPYRRKINHGERDQYFLFDSHPPIVDTEIFQSVSALINERSQKITTRKRTDTLFTKKIVCGVCGSIFKQSKCRQAQYWVCRNHYYKKGSCPLTQIPEQEIQAAFLRLYHKLKLHGKHIFGQMISDLQTIREKRWLWSVDIVELNNRISDITDQNQMLTEMNKLGLVDSDFFISQGNVLAQQLMTAKREKEQLLARDRDDTFTKTKELAEALEAMPDFLSVFDLVVFDELVEKITADSNDSLRFHLKNGLELIEMIERG